MNLKPYLTNIAISLRLMGRDRMVLVFSYFFPLIFFLLFAQALAADQGGAVAKQVVTSVLIFGVLGNGFFGAGMRAASDREQNILRRFKVAPTTAGPILTGSLITGCINYLPSAIFIIALGHFFYRMPWPERPVTLFVFLVVAILAFRALGLIVASVVNSMQESQVLTQLIYLPMLFLSGATFPISIMPTWVQILAQFLPATHLFSGLQGILIRQEGLDVHWKSLLALALTLIIGMFLAVKLFRWEKEEKVKTSAKLWVLAALAPFLILGVNQAYSKESLERGKALARDLRRGRTLLIRNARLFIGDGRVVERGSLLVREGKIAQVFEGEAPDAKSLRADPIEGEGKTLLPGLIDPWVQFTWPGGVPDPATMRDPAQTFEHSAAAYLYSGVTTVRSVGDDAGMLKRLRNRIASGAWLASDLLYAGPVITTRAAMNSGQLRHVPQAFRDRVAETLFRFPASPQDARDIVDALKGQGVSALRVDLALLPPDITEALRNAAREHRLPILASAPHPAADWVLGGVEIPDKGSWAPALVIAEASMRPSPALLDRSLVQQTAPKGLIEGTRAILPPLSRNDAPWTARIASVAGASDRIVAGTGSGAMFVTHGPAIHRELALLVEAGVKPADALQAATGRAAKALGIAEKTGFLKAGLEADLLLVDGNPLQEISATERISLVVFRGERVARGALFRQNEE
jgi:ABC-2 type transport system permease protein